MSIEEVLYLPFPLFSHEILSHLTALAHSRPPASQPTPPSINQAAGVHDSSSSSCKESEKKEWGERLEKKLQGDRVFMIQLF